MENVTTQQVLSAIAIGLLVILFAPRIIAMNAARGTMLRNTALWLLIFVGLVWVYNFLHPQPDGTTTASPQIEAEPTPLPPGQAF